MCILILMFFFAQVITTIHMMSTSLREQIFKSISLSVCLHFYMFVFHNSHVFFSYYFSLCLSFSVSLLPLHFISLFVYLSVSVSLFFCLFVFFSLYFCVCLYLFVCLSLSLSLSLSLFLAFTIAS